MMMADFLYYMWRKFLIFFGRLRVSVVPPMVYYAPEGFLVTGEEKQFIIKLLCKGDILIRKRMDYVDDWFLPGFFSHTAIYVGRGKIIHAIEKGVVKESVLDFLDADAIAILRKPNLTREQVNGIIYLASSLLGSQYDFTFDFMKNDRFTCTELVYCLYRPFLKLRPKAFLFKEIIIPDDFYFDKGLYVVFETKLVKENAIHIKDRNN